MAACVLIPYSRPAALPPQMVLDRRRAAALAIRKPEPGVMLRPSDPIAHIDQLSGKE
jgi:hypothetical protein